MWHDLLVVCYIYRSLWYLCATFYLTISWDLGIIEDHLNPPHTEGDSQMELDRDAHKLVGEQGSLPLVERDEVGKKFAMLIEGECEGLGPSQAAKKYGYTKQRYFQLLHAYREQGSSALQDKPRGPKRNYRRTDELVRQVIRHRFLDPAASTEVIAQKLRQTGFVISNRSVSRVIAEYGLQKKTLLLSSKR
jgi:transposase